MKIIIKFIKGTGRNFFVKFYVIVSLFPNMTLKYTEQITIIKHIVKLKCFIRVGVWSYTKSIPQACKLASGWMFTTSIIVVP